MCFRKSSRTNCPANSRTSGTVLGQCPKADTKLNPCCNLEFTKYTCHNGQMSECSKYRKKGKGLQCIKIIHGISCINIYLIRRVLLDNAAPIPGIVLEPLFSDLTIAFYLNQTNYSKTGIKQPLSKRPKIGFQDQLLLNAGQKHCRMLQGEHSAILLTFIKLPFVIKIFVLSIFEWLFYTEFTVLYM